MTSNLIENLSVVTVRQQQFDGPHQQDSKDPRSLVHCLVLECKQIPFTILCPSEVLRL